MDRESQFEGVSNETKPILRPGGQTCQCAGCGAFFSGVAAFDRHLTRVDTDSPKCRQPKEMVLIGMVVNVNGVWLTGISLKKLKEGSGNPNE